MCQKPTFDETSIVAMGKDPLDTSSDIGTKTQIVNSSKDSNTSRRCHLTSRSSECRYQEK